MPVALSSVSQSTACGALCSTRIHAAKTSGVIL